MGILLKNEILPKEVPDLKDIRNDAQKIASKITIGRTLFVEKYGINSEVEYKIKMKKQGRIMRHAAIGWNSWEETARGFTHIYETLSKRGLMLDRFGILLDWTMGLPENIRRDLPKGTGLILNSPDEWKAIGQVVPVQPHFGDHMIGSLNSVENVSLALSAGATVIGNVSQYFIYVYPVAHEEENRAVESIKAMAIMAELKDRGALVHSNLDDGFGSQFQDVASLVGWAMIEKYIVEDLAGAKLAHCFGNLFSNPMSRIVFLLALDEVHNDDDSVGSIVFGNTIDYTPDCDSNYGVLSTYLLGDLIAQIHRPTGHAISPTPIAEALRIPTPDEIIQANVISYVLEDRARKLEPYMNWEKIQAEKNRIVIGGQLFFERVLDGLDDIGIDTKNPAQLLLALKRIGAARLEEHFGVGKKDASGVSTRGRIPVAPTNIVEKLQGRQQELKDRISEKNSLDGVKVVIGTTDVHEYGKEIVSSGLIEAGAKVFDLGTGVEPQEVAEAVIETASHFVAISTFNGIALTFGRNLMETLRQHDLKTPVFMGGKLNENQEGGMLAVDVVDDLRKLGVICCSTADDLIDVIKGLIKTARMIKMGIPVKPDEITELAKIAYRDTGARSSPEHTISH
jgi:methylmalonyl-CoA mutase cobalamin-binding subunit